MIRQLAQTYEKSLARQLMNDPEANQIFDRMHQQNRMEDQERYNFVKEVVHDTVEETGHITFQKSYMDKPDRKSDVEMKA